MMEADDVDIDFFTPVASTSLAKIFTNNTKLEDKDDASLKYVPKSIRNVPQKDEESKATQVIYAGAFYGYEWFNNAYVSRGKLGAAILKNLKSEQHTMILYDFNKVTLSSTNVSMQLEIDIKENTNLSFYDNHQKYWSIYGAEIQISTFIEHLKSLNVQVKKSSNTEKGASQINIEKCEENIAISQFSKDNKESDTDSSINKKTKDSILKRMANVGQSVLPTVQTPNLSNSNDSPDSNESNEKFVRHKPQRSNIRNKLFEKVDVTDNSCVEINLNKMSPKLKLSDNIPISSFDHQLVPIKSTNIITNPIVNNSSELNLLMSEQRISNSELRININRMTDKIDKILETVQGIGDQGSKNVTISYQNSIVQKLITEYENKIKLYEDFLNSQGLDCNSILKASQEQESKSQKHLFDIDVHKNKIKDLQNIIENQNKATSKIQGELKSLEEKYNNLCKEKEEKYDNKTQEIITLKDELSLKNEELCTLSKTLANTSLQNNHDIKNELKSIMIKTFHSLSANFDSNESYTGTTVKSIIASVIKKETVEALK